MTKHLRILAPLLAAAALAAAGCGGGSSSETAADGYGAPVKQAAPAKQAAGNTVEISGSAFGPQSLDVKVGDTVTFVNQDEIAHTATADAFDSKTLEQGAKFDFTATKAGTIDYVCVFHPGMTGTITVS